MAMHAWSQKTLVHDELVKAGTEGLTVAEIVRETGLGEKPVRKLLSDLQKESLAYTHPDRVPGEKGVPVCKYVGRSAYLAADLYKRKCY